MAKVQRLYTGRELFAYLMREHDLVQSRVQAELENLSSLYRHSHRAMCDIAETLWAWRDWLREREETTDYQMSFEEKELLSMANKICEPPRGKD